MDERILNDNDFEGLKLYEENSLINKEVTPLMRKIISRLFTGTELNLDDFYFTVFEDENANAFFINKEATEEKKKNIIAISRGLLDTCNNEDELAGIIGHESGHYLWAEILGGKNTIFQERAADLRAIDLMINGGYNPLHHLNVCERVFSYGGRSYSDISLDVHGNGLARVEDIKARLTMIANEKGDFTIPDGKPDEEYLAVRNKAHAAYDKEGYDTYIEKCLLNSYGSKDLEKLSAEQIMNVIHGELEAGNLDINTRKFEIYKWVERLSEAKKFDNKSSELIDLCEKIFTKMHDDEAAILYTNESADLKKAMSDRNQGMLVRFQLEPFGDFAKQIENIKNFAAHTSKEDALHYARKMHELGWTIEYFGYLKNAKCATIDPKGKDNIGKKLPIDQFNEWLNEIPEENRDHQILSWAMDTVGLGNQYAKHYSWSDDYNHDEYFLDENKIVIAYGEEAKRLNKERDLLEKSRDFLMECERAKKEFDTKIAFYDKLARFSMTEDEEEKKALALELSEYFSDKDVRYNLDTPIFNFNSRADNPFYLRNLYIKEIYDRFNNSLTKQYFCDNLDGDSENIFRVAGYRERLSEEKRFREIIVDDEEKLQRALATLKDKDMYADITRRTNKYNHREFREKVCTSLMELADYVALQNEGRAVNIYGLIDEQLVKFSKPIFDYGDEQHKKNMKEMEDKFKNSIRVIQQKKLRRASKVKEYVRYPMLYRSSSTTPLDLTVLDNFRYREHSEILKNAMAAYGFDYEASMDATLKRLDHLMGNTAETSVFNDTQRSISNMRSRDGTLDFWYSAGILVAANAVREGKDFDLKNMLKYLRVCKTSSYYAPTVTDIFAEAIKKHNKFNTLPLKDKLYVYETMNDLDLFSEKYANKAEFYKAIVKDIQNHPNHDEAMEITERLLSQRYAGDPQKEHELKSHDIEFANEKDILIAFYAKGKADMLGIDDGSDAYYEKAEKLADELCAPIKINGHYYDGRLIDHTKFPRGTLQDILDQISTNVVSQELTAQMLSERGDAKFSQQDAKDFDIAARCAEGVISTLAKNPESAKIAIDFLRKKCTPESIDEVFNSLPKSYDFRRGTEIKIHKVGSRNITLDNFSLQLLHDNFWNADLPVRAYLMNRILKAYSSNDEDVLNLVVDMHFDEKLPYYKEAKRVVKTVFKHLKPYERNLILAALVAANQKDANNNQTGGEAIGEGLKMFFENKGPAFVKFGQLLSYLPVLDSDIRKPLAKLRDKADIPTRADLFKLMKETLPNEELAKIGRVDKILGAGSFFITAKIEYEGKPCVAAIMRPYAKDLAQSGMDMIYETIVDLSKQKSMYKPLLNITTQARLSAMSETDIEADYAKFVEAVKIYDDVKIITPQGEYTPEVAKWMSYGKGKEDQVYKIMSMAEGRAMTSAEMPEQTKHDMAVAYVALELTNLLTGRKWDTDRHQGQQNLAENGFKKFVIGIFDTGAQMQNNPKFKDKMLLGELLYGMARAARNGESIADYMVNKVKDIDRAGNRFNFNTLYIDEVQRGLTALSDIITYQKEIKDEKGRVIQPEKSLSSKEMGEIVTAILDSGLVDKKVKMTITAKAILNKIRITRKGWISSLGEGIKKISSSIKIEKQSKDFQPITAKRIDKPQTEIDALAQADKKGRILGVSLRHIKNSRKRNSQNYAAAAFTKH